MGVPTSEVGYTPAMPRRENHEVHKGHVVALGGGGGNMYIYIYSLIFSRISWRALVIVDKPLCEPKDGNEIESLQTSK